VSTLLEQEISSSEISSVLARKTGAGGGIGIFMRIENRELIENSRR